MNEANSIAAIATPPGSGAIAVIRVSGDDAISLCDKLFRAPTPSKKLADQAPNTIHYGYIVSGDEVVDEVMISLFYAPRSYTGENTAEISCHGSPYIQQRILQVLTEHGARMAEPGEFTLRAFMNGKMDLSQAEGVADLIASNSAASKKLALQQMRGGFSEEIGKLRQELIHFISLVELELDFSEEDVEFADRKALSALIERVLTLLRKLIDSFSLGNVLKNGVPVVIAGAPNAGKSTLLNTLLNEERAIVSDIAGTTRDSIEDTITLEGITFRFIDTAGLRDTKDTIESLGIERTHSKMEEASIVILIIDARNEDEAIREQMLRLQERLGEKSMLTVVNKMDLAADEKSRLQELQALENGLNQRILPISAKYRQNIKKLEGYLLDTVNLTANPESDIIVSNVRHQQALNQAYGALNRARQGIANGISGDFLSQDVREALHYLGEITGEVTTDEVLGNIFQNFCIGK